jgi:hypothetical protein
VIILLPFAQVGEHYRPSTTATLTNIFLFMVGGPSQIDMFDPKPALQKYAGERPPNASNFRTERAMETAYRMQFEALHATLLWQLGIDHEKLTYRYAGRDFRLTDVYGNVVREILA